MDFSYISIHNHNNYMCCGRHECDQKLDILVGSYVSPGFDTRRVTGIKVPTSFRASRSGNFQRLT